MLGNKSDIVKKVEEGTATGIIFKYLIFNYLIFLKLFAISPCFEYIFYVDHVLFSRNVVFLKM